MTGDGVIRGGGEGEGGIERTIKWDGWDVNMGSLPEGVLNERRGC